MRLVVIPPLQLVPSPIPLTARFLLTGLALAIATPAFLIAPLPSKLPTTAAPNWAACRFYSDIWHLPLHAGVVLDVPLFVYFFVSFRKLVRRLFQVFLAEMVGNLRKANRFL